MNNKSSIFVVFGLNTEQKPHAAQFVENDVDVAAKAAGLIGFKIGWAKTPEALAIASELPEGKVFATGKALVPYVKQEIYEKLASLAESGSNGKPGSVAPAPKDASPDSAKVAASDLWAEIKVGSSVIAHSPAKDDADGYWEAVVLDISRDGDRLTLRFKDFPEEGKFTARRRQVALLPSQISKAS